MLINSNFFSEVHTFIDAHKTLCVLTLGLAIAGYAVGNLTGRIVTWLYDCFRTTEKTQQAAQKVLNEKIVEEINKNSSKKPMSVSLLKPIAEAQKISGDILPSQQEMKGLRSESAPKKNEIIIEQNVQMNVNPIYP